MSQENVEAFKRALEAGNRGDIEGLLAELDPKVVWRAALPMLGGDAVYRGHEGVREFLLDVWEVIADTEFDFPEIRDVGDQVVGLGHFRGRGQVSGVETETPFAYVRSSEEARRSGFGPISIPRTPSKPSGCGSKRCRRRTWRSCG